MKSHQPFHTPSEVTAVDGEVQIDGPDGIAFAMTPEAASITAERLAAASREAARQRGGGDPDVHATG